MKYAFILYSALVISACSISVKHPTPEKPINKFLGSYHYSVIKSGGNASPVSFGECSIHTSPLGGVNMVIDSFMTDNNYNYIPLSATVNPNGMDFTIPTQLIRADTVNGNGRFLSTDSIQMNFTYHTALGRFRYNAALKKH